MPFFQPLVDLNTRQIIGFEALARWRSPSRGLVEAESFIATAERTGLVGPLTFSVLEQAVKEARAWPPSYKLAVNISPVQFRDPMLAEQILKLLATHGFPATRLEVEITEGSLLEDRDQVLTIIGSLKNVGVTISLDDFGTGYASLAQVNRLPLDRIKIDKSFITTIVKSEQTAAIVSTIAGLGHNLDVPISAEGVESEQIRNALAEFGCTEAQGWLFGRAISAEAVRSFLDVEPDRPRRFARGNETRPQAARQSALVGRRQLAGASAAGKRRSGEDGLPVDIARRRITTNQIVPIRRVNRAADAGRRWPNHLRIMGNIFQRPVWLVAGKRTQPNCCGQFGPELPGSSRSFSRLHNPTSCSAVIVPCRAMTRFSRSPGRPSRGE